MFRKVFLVITLVLFIVLPAYADERVKVSGVVRNAYGDPVAGAEVIITCTHYIDNTTKTVQSSVKKNKLGNFSVGFNTKKCSYGDTIAVYVYYEDGYGYKTETFTGQEFSIILQQSSAQVPEFPHGFIAIMFLTIIVTYPYFSKKLWYNVKTT